MVDAVTDMERIIQLRSWRDELVLSAMRAREKGYFHTADALDRILLDEMDLSSLDTQAGGRSVVLDEPNDFPPCPVSACFAKLGDSG